MSAWVWSIDGWIVLVGVFSACSCTLLGNYLVLRRMSLMGDAISHAVLPGLAVAFLLTARRDPWTMFVGAVIVGVLTSVLSQAITRYGKVEHGAAMGVVFSVLFAVGLILIRRAAGLDGIDLDPDCVLYGNIVLSFFDTVDWLGPEMPRAVVTLGGVLLLNTLFILVFYKELKICAFDPALATTLGINASLMHYVLMVLVAVTTVANFEAVGSILVIAMLIVPASTAHLLTDRLGVMILLSVVIAAGSAVLGHTLAFLGPSWVGLDDSANTAAMMAVVTGLFLLVVLLFAPQYGLVSRLHHRFSLTLNIIREDILGLMYRWQELQPERERPIHRRQVLDAVGGGWLPRWALWSLKRRNEIASQGATAAGPALTLRPNGLAKAVGLVRSHRLWESYLAKHFDLPLDHLHMPAERMEHYITPEIGAQLEAQLREPSRDPHGRAIPERPES